MPGTTLVQNATAEGANTGVTWYSYNYVRSRRPPSARPPAPRHRPSACGLAGAASAPCYWRCSGGGRERGAGASGGKPGSRAAAGAGVSGGKPARAPWCACAGPPCGERGVRRAGPHPLPQLRLGGAVRCGHRAARVRPATPLPSAPALRGFCSRLVRAHSKQRAAGNTLGDRHTSKLHPALLCFLPASQSHPLIDPAPCMLLRAQVHCCRPCRGRPQDHALGRGAGPRTAALTSGLHGVPAARARMMIVSMRAHALAKMLCSYVAQATNHLRDTLHAVPAGARSGRRR